MYTVDEEKGLDDSELVRHYADEIEHLQKLAKEQPAFAKICQEEIKELEKNYASMTLSGKNVGSLVQEELKTREKPEIEIAMAEPEQKRPEKSSKNEIIAGIKKTKNKTQEPKAKVDESKVASFANAMRPKKKEMDRTATM